MGAKKIMPLEVEGFVLAFGLLQVDPFVNKDLQHYLHTILSSRKKKKDLQKAMDKSWERLNFAQGESVRAEVMAVHLIAKNPAIHKYKALRQRAIELLKHFAFNQDPNIKRAKEVANIFYRGSSEETTQWI